MEIGFTPTPDDETATAVVAAIAHYLDQDEAGDAVEASVPRSIWSTAALLAAQGLPPTRGVARATWAAAERSAREACWSYGIVGL